MASIYKRGKVWWIHWRNSCGRRICESLKTRDRTIANRLKKHYEIEERRASLRGGAMVEAVYFENYIDEYLRVRRNQIAPRTVVSYRQALKSLCAHTGSIPLDRIRATDIENWRSGILDKRSPATANALLRHVKAAFNYAVEHGYLRESPLRYIRAVRQNSKPMRILSQAEVAILLENLSSSWGNLVRAAIYTGARSGELCRLRPGDVDLNQCIVTIRSTAANPTKSKKTRLVPVPTASRDYFTGMIDRAGQGMLLQNEKGFSWTTNQISKFFKPTALKCGIEACTFHDLRRTYGAWLVMEGVDLVTVQQNLGHSDISVTVKHYAHMMMDHRSKQVNRLPAI